MFGIVHIGGKSLTAQEAIEKLNNIGLDAGDFLDAMQIFNLEFPFEDAIQRSSLEITKSEAI